MITREILKTEIDFVRDEYLDVLYRFYEIPGDVSQ